MQPKFLVVVISEPVQEKIEEPWLTPKKRRVVRVQPNIVKTSDSKPQV